MRVILAATSFWGCMAFAGAVLADVHMFYGAATLALLCFVVYLLTDIRKGLRR